MILRISKTTLHFRFMNETGDGINDPEIRIED